MIQDMLRIERSIKERRFTDLTFINYWLYLFIFSPFTLFIYPVVMFFKRINRIDRFIERKEKYYNSVIDYTEKKAKEMGVYASVRGHIYGLKGATDEAFLFELKKIHAGLSFILMIITFGIYGFIVQYKINKIWYLLQHFEHDFDEELSDTWMKLNLIKYPIIFTIYDRKKRPFFLYFLLSVFTFGIWAIVWDYQIHTDPEKLYPEFQLVEDTIRQTIRFMD